MTENSRPRPEENADGTSYRKEAGEGRDLGDADGTSYRKIAEEDNDEEAAERVSADTS